MSEPQEAGEGVVLSPDLMEAHVDEALSLSEATDVTLRSLQIASVGNAFLQTPCLEVLSLSHNRLSNLEGFQHLSRLQYLNLNFNTVASLEGIGHCSQLRELFLSDNSVVDLTPLSACTQLRCLGLFKNQVSNLDSAVFALCSLPELKELDLSGNPVASSPAYKHRLITDIPGLETLDAESLGSSDAEVASRFFERNPEYARPRVLDSSAQLRERSVSQHQDGGNLRPGTPPVSGALISSATQPPNDPKLFRSEFLNNHPILLEYIVDNTISSRPSSARPGTASRPGSREDQPTGSGRPPPDPQLSRRFSGKGDSLFMPGGRRSFVDRLRTMAAEVNAEHPGSFGSMDAPADFSAGEPQMSQLEEELLSPESGLSPQQAIRRLLQICEQLELERDAAEDALRKARGRGSISVLTMSETEAAVKKLEKLHADNKRLSLENTNMYILLEENKRLKAQLEKLGNQHDGAME